MSAKLIIQSWFSLLLVLITTKIKLFEALIFSTANLAYSKILVSDSQKDRHRSLHMNYSHCLPLTEVPQFSIPLAYWLCWLSDGTFVYCLLIGIDTTKSDILIRCFLLWQASCLHTNVPLVCPLVRDSNLGMSEQGYDLLMVFLLRLLT